MKIHIERDYGDESYNPDNIYRRKIQEIEDIQWKNYSRGAQWENFNRHKVISSDIAMEVFRRQESRNRANRMKAA